MVRVKRGVVSHYRHKKLLSAVKGYRGTKHRLVKVAHESLLHAGANAYVGRKNRKRDMRRAWILRVSEAVKKLGLPYGKLIFGLKKAKIEIDRKILAELVAKEPKVFEKIVEMSKPLPAGRQANNK